MNKLRSRVENGGSKVPFLLLSAALIASISLNVAQYVNALLADLKLDLAVSTAKSKVGGEVIECRDMCERNINTCVRQVNIVLNEAGKDSPLVLPAVEEWEF